VCYEEDYQTIPQDFCAVIGADHRGSTLSDEHYTDHYYKVRPKIFRTFEIKQQRFTFFFKFKFVYSK